MVATALSCTLLIQQKFVNANGARSYILIYKIKMQRKGCHSMHAAPVKVGTCPPRCWPWHHLRTVTSRCSVTCHKYTTENASIMSDKAVSWQYDSAPLSVSTPSLNWHTWNPMSDGILIGSSQPEENIVWWPSGLSDTWHHPTQCGMHLSVICVSLYDPYVIIYKSWYFELYTIRVTRAKVLRCIDESTHLIRVYIIIQ